MTLGASISSIKMIFCVNLKNLSCATPTVVEIKFLMGVMACVQQDTAPLWRTSVKFNPFFTQVEAFVFDLFIVPKKA